MGKLIKVLVVLVVVGGVVLYLSRSGMMDQLTGGKANPEGVRVEEKYGFTSETVDP